MRSRPLALIMPENWLASIRLVSGPVEVMSSAANTADGEAIDDARCRRSGTGRRQESHRNSAT